MLFSVSVHKIINIDILSHGFKTKGLGIDYTFWRLIFSISCFICILSSGNFILKYLEENKGLSNIHTLKIFVYSFSYGLLFFSFLGIILGFLGFLNSIISYSICGFILFFSGRIFFLKTFNIKLKNKGNFFEVKNISLKIAVLTLLGTTLTFFTLKGLLPFETDGDIWGHYLHHFKIVKENSKIFANYLWYHFHFSKGAGLFYFFISLSDLLTPQIISALCVIFVSIILIDIVYTLSREKLWSLVAAILFLTSITIISPTNLFKHHPFFMFLIMIMFWSLIEIINSKDTKNYINLLLIITTFYIGFFYPTISLIICVYLLICLIVIYFFFKNKFKISLYANIALIAGVITSLLINYYYTGMFENIQTKLFWKLANQNFFVNKYGFSPIEYNLIANDGLNNRLDFLKWFKLFIEKLSWPLLTNTAVSIFLSSILISTLLKKNNYKLKFFLIFFLVFNLVSFSFAFFLQQASIVRVYIFVNGFIYIPFCIFIPLFFKTLKKTKFFVLLKNTLAMIVILPAFFSLAITLSYYSKPLKNLYLKNISLADTYSFSIHNKDRRNFFNFALKIRDRYPEVKMYLLSSSGGPASFLPMPGFIGEPQMALGKDWDNINSSKNIKYIKSILKNKGINYFVIDLSKELWGNLVFSQIFNNENLRKNFKILEKDKDFYLLTWQNDNSDKIKSKKFLSLIELKRSSIINAILSKSFNVNFLNNGFDMKNFYKILNYKKNLCLKNENNKLLINKIIKNLKQSDKFINDFDDKIKNIQEITRSTLLKNYGGLYSLDFDLSELAPHKKIYLHKLKNKNCGFIY